MTAQRVTDYMDLRIAIRARREELGLSVQQLAKIAGLPASRIAAIEGGGSCLKPATYRPVLAALGLRIVIAEAAR